MADAEPMLHIRKAGDRALLHWARKVWQRSTRKPEGEVLDDGSWKATAREDFSGRNKHSARSYQTWYHTYRLCERSTQGLDVPPDIAESFAADYPLIHEREMLAAVDKRLKDESDAHEATQKELAKATAKAESQTASARLTERRAQLVGLELKLKKLHSKEKALLTRMKRVKRSIDALERSIKKGTS